MKDVQKTRVESQQGDTHVVKETTKTTVSSKKPMSTSAEQLIQQVPLTKQQLTYAVPIVLAIVLALAIMYFRNGGLFGHREPPHQPSYTEQASNMAQQLKENLMPRERTWSEKASDYLLSYVPFYHRKTAYEQTADYASSAAQYAKEKASQAAGYAQEKLSPTAQRAAELAAEKAQQASDYAKTHGTEAAKQAAAKAKEAAQYAYEHASDAAQQAAASAKDSVNDARENIHDYAHSQRSYATQAKDYVADKITEVTDTVKSTIGGITESVQHKVNEAKEAARHNANMAAENARHAAAEMGGSAQDIYNSAKVKGHEYRREAKDKLAQAGETL